MDSIKLIECPRDAMQGLTYFVDTELKIEYINALLEVGFDTLDVGSFVSPKMIPQMRDTPEVLDKINWSKSRTKLLTIVGNRNGAERAVAHEQVTYLGYPFSISETFQKKNTNATINESLTRLREIQDLCYTNSKTLVVYLSMGFGNPYGDFWSPNLVEDWTKKIKEEYGVKIISLSDTIGAANPTLIREVFERILPNNQDIEIGAHLHAKPNEWQAKIEAAKQAGCMRFDGAIKGYGGCPYASDRLTGNIPTELMVKWFEAHKLHTNLDIDKLNQAIAISRKIFN
jgi:hydroxymethylglutaryl-CoA lyase